MQSINQNHNIQEMSRLVSNISNDKTPTVILPEDELTHCTTSIGLNRYPDKYILNAQELAQALGCSLRTLTRRIQRFEVPEPVRVGKERYWVAGIVKEWLTNAASRQAAESEKEARRLRVISN